MRALTVEPGRAGSLAVIEVDDPVPGEHELLVEGVAIGVCGTDKDIVATGVTSAPPGATRLILGHESLGRVRHAPVGSGFRRGDLVAGVVRRPDPEPCGACARGEFDMCRNGLYTERGIKEAHGYGSELWTVPPEYAVRLDPELGDAGVLMEPASVVAKAWAQVDAVGGRSWFEPKTALVTGAGPIGLLAALIGVQRGLDVHVLDRNVAGPKPRLVRDLGAAYHAGAVSEMAREIRPDVIIEATGAPALVLDAIEATTTYGIACLTGVPLRGEHLTIDPGALGTDLVMGNNVVIGSVNANLGHFAAAAEVLAAADRSWLTGLLTRSVPLEEAPDAFEARDGDVKVVITL